MRIGTVPYLNSLPLTAALAKDNSIRLTTLPPSCLAEAVLRGDVDVALAPTAAILENGLYAYPDAGVIACDGAVKSVGLFVKDDLSPMDIETVYWDSESRTSVVLAQILLNKMFGRNLLSFKALAPDHCRKADAQLLIGDKALFFHEDGYRFYDLGELWKNYTGLGFMFACWASSFELKPAEIRRLAKARDMGASHLTDYLAPMADKRREILNDYLTKNIVCRYTDAVAQGYELFTRYARELNLLAPPDVADMRSAG